MPKRSGSAEWFVETFRIWQDDPSESGNNNQYVLSDMTLELSRALEAAETVLRVLKSHFRASALPALTGGPLGLALCHLQNVLSRLRNVLRKELGCISSPDADYVQVLNLNHETNVVLYQLRRAENAVTAWAAGRKRSRRHELPKGTFQQFEAAVQLLREVVRVGQGKMTEAEGQGRMTEADPPAGVDRMREVIRRHPNGRTAPVKFLLEKAGLGEKKARKALRYLEARGEYEGFARKRPARYTSS
jgi:hypothetical protein